MCKVHSMAISSVLLLALSGCSKGEATSEPAASVTLAPTDVPTIRITGTPPAVSVASIDAGATTPTTATSGGAATDAGKSAKTAAAASGSAAGPAEPLKGAQTHVTGKNFALDVASPGCRADTTCAVTLRLTTAGDYHVNKEYPYKFIATATPGIDYLGSGTVTQFSREQGDFKEEGEKAATLTVRFKAKSAGTANVSGTYKMSVCSAENCQVEQQPVTLAVPVM